MGLISSAVRLLSRLFISSDMGEVRLEGDAACHRLGDLMAEDGVPARDGALLEDGVADLEGAAFGLTIFFVEGEI